MIVVEKENIVDEKIFLEGILKTYEIPLLPGNVLSSKISFPNGRPPLSLKEALSYPPEKIVAKQLSCLENEQIKVDKTKESGRKKSLREITEQRDGKRRENRLNLLKKGPKRILAAIAANNGKEARFTRNGIDGSNEWVRPSNGEERWWGWIYEQKKSGEGVEDWLSDSGQANIIHAYYVMRLRLIDLGVTEEKFNSFREDMARIITENDNLIPILRKVNLYFDQFSGKR